MTSFKNRLLILIVSLMALAQGVTIVLALASIRDAVRADSARQLTATRAMLDSTFAERARLLRAAADVLVADFAFREVIATTDRATMQSALNNHAGRVGADLAVLYAPDGHVLAATTPALARQASAGLHLPEPGSTAPFAVVGGRPYQIVFAPLRAPEIIAWVALGFELDQTLAEKLAALAGTDVSFVYHEPGAFNGYTSTLEPAMAGELAALSLHRPGASTPELMTLNEQEFLTLSAPLRTQAGGLELVVQRSQLAAMAQFREMRFALLLIGGAALLGAILVAWLAGRSAVRPLGVLVNAASQIERGYYSDHIQVQGAREFQQLAGTFNSMQEGIREREARILRQATYDTLTALLNREGLRERLATLEHHGACSVALLDVHRFRDINASVGHQAGDQLLQALAARISQVCNAQLPCARVGADQFVVVAALHDTELLHRVLVMADELRRGVELGSLRLSVDVRAGISEWREPRAPVEDLLRQADVALLQAKEQSTVGVVYQPSHDAEHRRRVLLVAELRRALAGEGLSLHYQPLVNMTDRVTVGFEALLRWSHPTLGSISPAEFVPLAERASVLPDLSRWVLGTAIAQLGQWQRAGLDLDVAVNLSAADFADGGLPARVLALLREHDVPATRLLLELTESAIMREPQLAAQVMQQLRTAGVRFAIDDFGTGHSSLAQLHALPVDELKIDRGFVMSLDRTASNLAIVRSTIELGHSLGLKVLAEGVETPEVWAALLRLGCDLAQGYFISRPMPAASVPNWARTQSALFARALTDAEETGRLASIRGRNS
ncbi:MAG TPA: EAL domain-containing protein [Steroidobacteraceae bacterium]|nr:EAL domain-containing protein [Steroidobacteraceae bacterium]